MTTSKRKKRLSDRDRPILTQAYEDLVTPTFILLRHFKGQTITAAQSEVRRLCAASLLYSLPLAGRRRYYRLTRHGAQAIQVHSRHTRPLKRQGLVNRFAISWFFNVHDLERSYRFDPSQWIDQFPEFANRRYWRRPFYIREEATNGTPRFGIVLVDHGASQRRLFSKVTELLAELIRSGWLDPRQTDRRLTLTLLTFNASRAESLLQTLDVHLRTHLKAANSRELVSIEVLCVPELDSLVITTNERQRSNSHVES